MSRKHPLWGTVARDARTDDTQDDRSRPGNRTEERSRGPRGHGDRPGERRDSRPAERGEPRREARPTVRPGSRPAPRPGTRRTSPPNTPEAPCAILPGVKPVLELLESDPGRVEAVFIRQGRRGHEVDRIVELCREARVRFTFAEPHVLDRLFASGHAIGQPDAEPGRVDFQRADGDPLPDDDTGIPPGSVHADDADRPPALSRPTRSGRPAPSPRASHQGVIARVFDAGFANLGDMLRDAPDAPLPLIVALDQVQDPGNVGALARTLYALGAAGLVVVRHGGAALGGAAARAAAGALEKLPVAKVTNLARALDDAHAAGYAIYAAAGDGAATAAAPDAEDRDPGNGPRNPFTEPLRTPAVLVLGNEDTGIRPNVAKRCHVTLSIPMARAVDSLNVAQAGAILTGCFAALRHRG